MAWGLLVLGAPALAVVIRARHVASESAPTVVASLAAIRAVGAASFTRLQPPPDELLQLDDGAIELDVAASAPGHRFRVVTRDAEIDVPAGRLSVRAQARTLVAVRIFAGYAEVRAKGGGHASLRAGDEWTPDGSPPAPVAQAAPAPPVAMKATAPSPSKAGQPESRRLALAPSKGSARAQLAPTPQETPTVPVTASVPQRASFERGWSLLRAGDAAQAAAAFRECEEQAGGDAIAEDAAFWRAVALARANLSADARRELTRFVARYSASARAGEASAMLGWLLLDSGDTDGARRAFERAQTDKVDRVRASAASGLERLAH
jgi:TolA-binding protein